MTYTFFLIDACLFVLPFFLAIDRKHFQVEIIRSAVVPALIQAIFFSEIAVFFVQSKVWSISPAYTLGFGYRSLPLEVYLLVFALGFTGISAYNYLNLRFPDNTFQKYSLAVSNLMIGF
ncbi:MAG: hypothetical protein REI93_07490, partial [Pedobacter sp.]|nr:hypothetical protein [Pedobacter sp.]